MIVPKSQIDRFCNKLMLMPPLEIMTCARTKMRSHNHGLRYPGSWVAQEGIKGQMKLIQFMVLLEGLSTNWFASCYPHGQVTNHVPSLLLLGVLRSLFKISMFLPGWKWPTRRNIVDSSGLVCQWHESPPPPFWIRSNSLLYINYGTFQIQSVITNKNKSIVI